MIGYTSTLPYNTAASFSKWYSNRTKRGGKRPFVAPFPLPALSRPFIEGYPSTLLDLIKCYLASLASQT